MSLIKRKPRKVIRITEAAKAIGVSSETIRNGLGGFQLFKFDEDKLTSPLYMYEAELEQFLKKLETASR